MKTLGENNLDNCSMSISCGVCWPGMWHNDNPLMHKKKKKKKLLTKKERKKKFLVQG